MPETNVAAASRRGDEVGLDQREVTGEGKGFGLDYQKVTGEEVDNALTLMSKQELIQAVKAAPQIVFYRHRETGELKFGWEGTTAGRGAGFNS